MKLARGLWRNRGALKREFRPAILAPNMLRNYNYFGIARLRSEATSRRRNVLNEVKRRIRLAPTTS
jgi:hypothetical protein